MKMLRIFKKKATPLTLGDGSEDLARLAGERAGNLFSAHGLSCSEAVLVVLDRGFGGGLGGEAALGLGSGFGGGVGGSGCLCGALSGAVMGLGLFLGAGCWEKHDKKEFRQLVADLHESFRVRSGSVCCRELIADFRGKRTERKHFCGDLTGRVAQEAARIILAQRPELTEKADRIYLSGRDSRIGAVVKKFLADGNVADRGK